MRRVVAGLLVAAFVAGTAPLARPAVADPLPLTGTVSGTVWLDADADGALDTGEDGIAFVTVRLRNAGVDGTFDTLDDIVLDPVTTDAAGHYAFESLPPGSYRVSADATTAPAGTALTTPGSTDVVLTLSTPDAAVDFGFRWTGAIGDLVWLDADGDGTVDAGENGISGVGIALVERGPDATFDTADDVTRPDAVTTSSGAYAFANLPAGTYRIGVDDATLPSGTTVAGAAADPTTLALAAGQARADVDFAVRYTGSIGDRVWLDADADGAQDAGETGVAGVTVKLSTPGADGTLGTGDDVVAATTATSSSGGYAFANLAPGTYRVAVDASTAPAGTALTTAGHFDVTLAPHAAVATADFGFRWTGSIGDLVWLDADGDGTRDTGEDGVSGVGIALVERGADGAFDTADDVVHPDAVTASSGAYAFANLPAGTYRLAVDDATLPSGTTVAGAATDPTTLTLAAGGTRADVDFAVRYTGSVGDRVWLDADADGAQDAGESGIAGVTVRLLTPGADGTRGTGDDVVAATTATDGSGAYLFSLLAPGDYRVSVDAATAPDGTAATTPVNVDVTLAPHGAVATADFGFRWTGSIGDRVWLDADADAAQDTGEPGVVGVTVRLSTPGPDGTLGTGDDAVAATTVTDGIGGYAFANLAPGDYRVTVDASTAPAGTALTTAGHVDTTLAPHGEITTADFGFRWTGSIGDLVWLDADGDGTVDAGESGISGVAVSLVEAGPDGTLGNGDDVVYPDATTDASGAYAFANLPPGTYRISADETALPPNTRIHNIASPFTLSLAAGEGRADVDFAAAPFEQITLSLDPAAVSTFAGDGTSANVDGTGTGASFRGLLSGGVAVTRGALFVGSNGYLRRVDTATGAVTTVAGSTSTNCTNSTTPTSVGFGSAAFRVATDGTWVYSVCPASSLVRRTSIATGATSTLATTSAKSLTLAPDGLLYVLGGNWGRDVYRVDPYTGATSLFAALPSTDVNTGVDIASDAAALWVVGNDTTGSRTIVKRVALADASTSTVLTGQNQVASASGIAVAGDYLYLTQSNPHALVRVAKADGAWAMAAGNNRTGGYNDGLEFDAWFNQPAGIVSDGSSLWIADNQRIRKAVPGTPRPRVTPTAPATTVAVNPASVSTFAGDGTSANVDGTGTGASFRATPGGLAHHDGALYTVAGGYVRRVDTATGAVTTIAGSTNTTCSDTAVTASVPFGTSVVRGVATDGSYLYTTCSYSGTEYVRRTSLLTGATAVITPTGAKSLTLAPDGLLYVLGGNWGRDVYRVDPYTGATSLFAALPSTDVNTGVDIASDAAALWVVGNDTTGSRTIVKRVALADASTSTVLTGQNQVASASGIAVAGDYLYLTIQGSPAQLIRVTKADGSFASIAGATPPPGTPTPYYADGIGVSAWLSSPAGIVSDGTRLWFADNQRIRRAIPGKLAAAQGGPTRPGELHGGGNPAGLYDPCACADPVSAETGNFYENHTDLAVPGRGPALAWTRSYNSQAAPSDGPLGWGWTHGYRMRLVDDPYEAGVKNVEQENGSRVSFTPGQNGWTAPTRVLAGLTTNGDGTYTFVRNKRELFDFDAAGALTAVRDLNGWATTLAYDGSGRLATVTDPAGRTLTLTYNASNRITRVADHTGRDVDYAYDAGGNLTDVTDVKNGNTHFAYDAGHLLLTVRDQRLGVVTNTYDSARRVLTQKDQLNRTTTFAYTDTTTTMTDPRGNATVYSFSDGMLTAATRAAGTPQAATTTFAYDPTTLARTATTDPNNRTTTATYDAAGNLLSSTDPLNRTTTHTYDALNDLLTVTDATNVTTTNTYDAAGNLLGTSRPLTGTSQVQTVAYAYGDASHPGDVTALTDPLGKAWTYAYDAFGNRTAETDPLGNTTTHAYDALGRRTATVSPRGNVTGADPAEHRTTFAYDAAGAVTSVTDPLAHVTTYLYDAAGNRTRTTDPDAHVTNYAYDLAGQLTTVTRPDTTTLTYAYDAGGNRTGETDGAGRTTAYAYDPLDRVASTTDPLSRTTTAAWDAAGNRTSVTDPAGRVTSFGHDAADRLTSVAYSDGTTPGVTYAYDNLDRRIAMTDGTGTTTYSWDSLGRLVSSTNGAGATVGHGWDLAGRRTSLTYPGGSVVAYAHDDAGRLVSVTDWLTNTTTFSWDADSNPVGRTLPNGTTRTDVFDLADRLASVDHRATGTSFASFSYGRSNAGLLTSATPTGTPQGAETYTYSTLDQLKTVNAAAYAYDAADNLTAMPSGAVLAYDVANQLQSSTLGGATTTYAHDSRGNRTSVTPPSGPATTLGWDQANRLVAYGTTATYAYDGDGLRASKTVSGATRPFVWDTGGGLPLLLKDGTDAYVYGPGGTPLERIAADGTVTWVHGDQLGSVRALTDSAGAVVGTFAYDAYGNPAGSTGTVSLPFGFAGEYRDAESGMVYLRARYYDPATGQFVSVDPAYATTQSRYGYVGGNPLNAVDPLGLAPWDGVVGWGRDRLEDFTATTTVIGGGFGWLAAEALHSVVVAADEHLGGSVTVCLYWCVGLEVQQGQLYLNYGRGSAVGMTGSVNYYSRSLDEWCPEDSDTLVGLGPVGGVIDSEDRGDYSVGYGPGVLFGTAKMKSRRLQPG